MAQFDPIAPQIRPPENFLDQQVKAYTLLNMLQKNKQEQEEIARIKEYRTALAGATTPEEQLAIASKYLPPDKLALVVQGMQNKQAANAKLMFDMQQKQAQAQAQQELATELAKPDEATAREAAIQADARGEQVNITARNPAKVQSLLAQVAPQQAATQLLKPLTPSGPLADTKAVTGGYLQRHPDGRIEFVRTQQDRPPTPIIRPVPGPGGALNYRDLRNPEVDLAPAPLPPAAAKAEDTAAKDEATLASVKDRIARMTQMVQSNAGIVGPAGIVRRMGETGLGVVSPGAATPALDYQNELRLLLADIRKVVEKDPNLSNEERRNLYETLGGGTFQTPGSAIRALNNVVSYVEGKKLTGRSLERRAPAAGTVQNGYRFKGGDPSQQSNWEKVE